MPPIKKALISVSDKTGVAEFAKRLTDLGITVISTGGTAKTLAEAGVAVTTVETVTGAKEILGGRVKTLHPKIHGGILAVRDNTVHTQEMSENGIETVDMVVVNLYPFEKTVAKPGVLFAEAVENIDIGGPAMVRAAAKNHRFVTVVTDPADYATVADEIAAGGVSDKTRNRLARKAFALTSRYDRAITEFLSERADGEQQGVENQDTVTQRSKPGRSEPERPKPERSEPGRSDNGESGVSGGGFPDRLVIRLSKRMDLRYGENPHQKGAFYVDEDNDNGEHCNSEHRNGVPPCVGTAEQIQGKELSLNNIFDTDSAFELAKEFDPQKGAVCVIVKHNNPCGVALGATVAEAFEKARACDPVSAFGGIIALNREADEKFAAALADMFVEVVIAPGFTADCLKAFAKKPNIRVLKTPPFASAARGGTDIKKVAGGALVQEKDTGTEADFDGATVPTKNRPTAEQMADLLFAWKVCKHVKSNAIVLAKGGATVGIGAGQMSRVDSVRLAAMKAQSPTAGCVMASDAFFPFRDGIDEAAKAGITAAVHPGGSVRDKETTSAADGHEMAVLLTGVRHFKH